MGNENRHSDGTHVFLPNGADRSKQNEAVVNQHDSTAIAVLKTDVHSTQRALNDGTWRPTRSVFANALLIVFLAITALLIGGIIARINWVEPSIKKNFTPLDKFSMNQHSVESMTNSRRTEIEILEKLYRPGTPVKFIHNSCADRYCSPPDMAAFEAYRRYASDPSAYDNQVCRFLSLGQEGVGRVAGVLPVWKIERNGLHSRPQCTMANYDKLVATARSENINQAIMAFVYAGAAIAFLGLLFFQARRVP